MSTLANPVSARLSGAEQKNRPSSVSGLGFAFFSFPPSVLGCSLLDKSTSLSSCLAKANKPFLCIYLFYEEEWPCDANVVLRNQTLELGQ
jgi:hypothetical protein